MHELGVSDLGLKVCEGISMQPDLRLQGLEVGVYRNLGFEV